MGRITAPDDEKQSFIWRRLHKQVVKFLRSYGVNEATGKGDYLVVDDNYGWLSVIVEMHQVHMLRPEIVAGLRSFLRDLPDWQIIVKISVPGTEGKWPVMGLTLRKHEIVDGVQRQFVTEMAGIFYEGGRPGTGDD